MKLIFVKPTNSTFMQIDEEILSCQHQLKSLCLNQNLGRNRYLMGILNMAISMIKNRDWELVLIWFADYHSAIAVAIARLLKRKSVVFIGGYDAVHYPEFGYGVYANPIRGFCARYALKNCDLMLANHEALLSSSNTYYQPSGHREGVYNLIPGLKTPAMVIHNAIYIDSTISSQRQRMILCVGGTPRYQDVMNKGFDLLFKVAPLFPEWVFVCVGINPEWMAALDSQYSVSGISNLVILPPIPHEESIALMEEASIYVQASISEGMPNALMEAMACGCLPIGSNVAGIPTVIQDDGFIIANRNVNDLAQTLKQAMAVEPDRQEIAQRLCERFSYDLRKDRILEAIRGLLDA